MDADARLVAINHVARDFDQFAAYQRCRYCPASTEMLMAVSRRIVDQRAVSPPLPSGENPRVAERASR